MYCATCGSLIDEKLNFCNRCGNRVVKGDEMALRSDATAAVLKSLSIATGVSAVIGLGGLIALITILIANHVEAPGVVFLAFLFAATVFGVCFLMTRQISRLSGNLTLPKENSKQYTAPEQLNAPVTGQIEAPAAPFRSVTENTTRTLDKTKV